MNIFMSVALNKFDLYLKWKSRKMSYFIWDKQHNLNLEINMYNIIWNLEVLKYEKYK